MSAEYDVYLQKHRQNVWSAYNWIEQELGLTCNYDMCAHDASCADYSEYAPCNAYYCFLGNPDYPNKAMTTFIESQEHHIRYNPHHWQHWVVHTEPDSPNNFYCLEMSNYYIHEMICDWWAPFWGSGNISGIFEWYAQHKRQIRLGERTRQRVEYILAEIARKLDISEHLWHYDTQEQKGEAGDRPPQLLSSAERSGGSNAEKGLKEQDPTLLIKGIRSLKKRIIEHEDKLSDPERYYPRWNAFSENRKKALTTHWNQEIEAFQKAINNREQELERRGYHGDK